METETDKLIKDQLATLPVNLQRAINATAWKDAVKQISQENNLNTDQSASLEQEVMLVIHAFEPLENFTTNMVREIGVSEEIANNIANSVAEKILDPISQKAEAPETEDTSTAPIIITKETKVDAMKELNRRSEEIEKMQAPLPEIRPDIHPVIEPEEKVHDVPHVEVREKVIAQVPDYRYEKGKDPYREQV